MDGLTARDETALQEAFMCSNVPDQCLKMNSFHIGMSKEVFNGSSYSVHPVATIPVSSIAYHYPHLRLFLISIKIEITTIPYVNVVQRFYGKSIALI